MPHHIVHIINAKQAKDTTKSVAEDHRARMPHHIVHIINNWLSKDTTKSLAKDHRASKLRIQPGAATH